MMETCGDNCACKTGGLFIYPDSVKEEFCRTHGYKFEDGRYVSAAEMWRFMTEEAPAKFPTASWTGGPARPFLKHSCR